jgi:electron transport complex protein RnfC
MGVQCFNVGTAYSAWRAIRFGEPLISRIVTITGNVAHPQNFEALIGTPMSELVAQADQLPGTTGYIMGGPMMGVLMPSKEVGVIKATNCIIASSDAIFPKALPTLPCIRCTRCADVCPSELQPQELYWFSKAKNLDKAEDYHLFDCIECGACSYVCPSNIPLVQYYRFAKSEIWARDAGKKAADAARERHEFRESRIEREKREKAEKLAAKEKAAQEAKAVQPAIAPVKPDADPENTLQLKIQTAIDHAKEQAAAIKPKNTEQLTPEQQAQIDDIEARRARIRELAKDATPT